MIRNALTATNAAKAVVGILLSQVIEFSEAFGLYDFTPRKEKALEGIVMAAYLGYVLATYKLSHKRDDRAEGLRV